jgi:hypothetical protein
MSEPLTFDLAVVAARIGGVSERWLAAQLRSGNIPGRKVGRKWRMTHADIDACLEVFKVCPKSTAEDAGSVRGVEKSSASVDVRQRRGTSRSVTTRAPDAQELQYPLFP